MNALPRGRLPRVVLRESDAKFLLNVQTMRKCGKELRLQFIRATRRTVLSSLRNTFPWIDSKLSCKADEMFSQRSRHGMTLTNATQEQVTEFIQQKTGPVTINDVTGSVKYFIVEPYIPHTQEFFLSIEAARTGTNIFFNSDGKTKTNSNTVFVSILNEVLTPETLDTLLKGAPNGIITALKEFICCVFTVFCAMDMTLFVTNQLVVTSEGTVIPLGLTVELDTASYRRHITDWEDLTFPPAFGMLHHPEEASVAKLNNGSDSTFHLRVLRPNGRLYLLTAGTGAARAVMDICARSGLSSELAAYAELAGHPNEEETYKLARSLISIALASKDNRNKAFIFVGGLASYTDVLIPYKGLAYVLKEFAEPIRRSNIWVFLRRIGPNISSARTLIGKVCKDSNIHCTFLDHECTFSNLITLAAQWMSETPIVVQKNVPPPLPILNFWSPSTSDMSLQSSLTDETTDSLGCTCSCFPCYCGAKNSTNLPNEQSTISEPTSNESLVVNSKENDSNANTNTNATNEWPSLVQFDADFGDLLTKDAFQFVNDGVEKADLQFKQNRLQMRLESAKLLMRLQRGYELPKQNTSTLSKYSLPKGECFTFANLENSNEKEKK